jgi:hypothetical protein
VRAHALLALGAWVLCTAVGPAHADTDEWRLEAAGTLASERVHAAAAEGQATGVGGQLVVSRGLTNSIDALATLSLHRAQAVPFTDAKVQGQTGTLYADSMGATAGVGARLSLGVETARVFERLHPFVAVAGGLLLRALTGQELVNPRNMVLVESGDDYAVLPYLEAAVGLERRFGDHWFVVASADLTLASDFTALGGSLGLGWSFY